MSLPKQKILSVFLKLSFIIALVCSTAYLLMLGWYNYLVADDFWLVNYVNDNGVWGMTRDSYLTWHCRFSCLYVYGWIMKAWGHASNLIGYTILLLILGYATLYYAVRRLTGLRDRWLVLGCAMLMTNVTIMAYLNLSAFYWISCSQYTLSAYAAIVLMVTILKSNGRLWLRWLMVIVCSMYLGGGAENFTPILITLGGVWLLYQMVTSRSCVFWRTTEQRMILVSMLILAVGFVAVTFGPGNRGRIETCEGAEGFMGRFALLPYIGKFVKASAVFYMRLLARAGYYILLFPLGWLLGVRIKKSGYAGEIKAGKAFLVSLIVSLFAIEVSIAASVYGIGWFAAERSYCFVSYIMAALAVYWGVLSGLRVSNEKVVSICVVSANIIIAGMSCSYIRSEQPLVADVYGQIENCYTQILEHQQAGKTEPLVVTPITYPYMPDSYAIMRNLIRRAMGKSGTYASNSARYFPYKRLVLSRDPKDFKNDGVRHWQHVDFDIIGWE